MNHFGAGSRRHLIGVHPDLVLVSGYAITFCEQDFSATDGARSEEEQRANIIKGVSWTMNSRHLPFLVGGVLLAHAVDLVPWIPGSSVWKLSSPEQWILFRKIASAMKRASRELKIPVLWGGDWRTHKDGPHWYLSRRHYPKGAG